MGIFWKEPEAGSLSLPKNSFPWCESERDNLSPYPWSTREEGACCQYKLRPGTDVQKA